MSIDFYNAYLETVERRTVPFLVTRVLPNETVRSFKTKSTVPINKGWVVTVFKLSEVEFVFDIHKRSKSYKVHIIGKNEYEITGEDINNVVQYIVDVELIMLSPKENTLHEVKGWIYPGSLVATSIDTFVSKNKSAVH